MKIYMVFCDTSDYVDENSVVNKKAFLFHVAGLFSDGLKDRETVKEGNGVNTRRYC